MQEWIINYTVKNTIIATLQSHRGKSIQKKSIQCNYRNSSIFVTSLEHEDKLVLFLHKYMIISKAEKKLLEKFAISTTIKDIIVVWS